jgi:hypothetical protein
MSRDPPDAQSMVTAERGTTRIIGNSTGDPKNSLVCKSENQDIKCSFEQPITGISMTSTQSTYDFDKLRVENAITCGSLISQHSTFDFELDIVNPMNTFVLPDSVSEAAEQGRYISPPEFSCKGSRKRGGLSSEDINGWNFLIETKCTNGLSYIEAIYERPFVGAPNLKLLLASLHHIGVGGMDIRWNVNMKIGKGEEIEGGECEGEVCRREDFEAEIQRIAFGNFVNATCTERCGI